MIKKLYYAILISSITVAFFSMSHAQLMEKDFFISSEFRNWGVFNKINLTRFFWENKLTLSLEFYGDPQINQNRNIKFIINGYPYYASQESSVTAFGGSLAVYYINGPKADGDVLPDVLSNASTIEIEIPLKNLKTLSWTLPKSIVSEWKELLKRETPVHKLSRDQISQLYISILGRASEGSANAYWCANYEDMVSAANAMLGVDGVKEYFGTSFNDNKEFIKLIYNKTLGKDPYEDPVGINYWTSQLNQGKTKGQVVVDLIKSVTDPVHKGSSSQKRLYNRMEISSYVAENIPNLSTVTNIFSLQNLVSKVDSNSYSLYLAKNSVDKHLSITNNPNTDDEEEEDHGKQPPAPYDLKIEKKEANHILTWMYPASGDIANIEVWVAEGSQRRDDAKLVVVKPVEQKDMGKQGEYVHSGFADFSKVHTYWIRSISLNRYHSVWCPPDKQGGYVVPATTDSDATDKNENQ